MVEYCIYLKCDGGSGYYTGTTLTYQGQEVLLHPSVYRAKRFDDRSEAFHTARKLKINFKCVLSYEVKPLN